MGKGEKDLRPWCFGCCCGKLKRRGEGERHALVVESEGRGLLGWSDDVRGGILDCLWHVGGLRSFCLGGIWWIGVIAGGGMDWGN
jgi:hypothetical protein